MRKLTAAACVLALITGAASAQVLPSRKAMREHMPGLWIDANANAEQADEVVRRIGAAGNRVKKALGSTGTPQWRVCVTKACDKANGMQFKGVTYGKLLVTINSEAWQDTGAYTHEYAHATLHGAQPMIGLLRQTLPLWFDEGVAVIISGEPPEAADKKVCAKPPRVPLPKTTLDFQRAAGTDPKKALPIYKASACAVRGWLKQGNKMRDVVPTLKSGRSLP